MFPFDQRERGLNEQTIRHEYELQTGFEPLSAKLALVFRRIDLRMDLRPAAPQFRVVPPGRLGNDRGRGNQGPPSWRCLDILQGNPVQGSFPQPSQPTVQRAVVRSGAFNLLDSLAQPTRTIEIPPAGLLNDRQTEYLQNS